MIDNETKLRSTKSLGSHIHCIKKKPSSKDIFRECEQNSRKLRIWSHLLKKSLMESLLL